jgi:hypothetical protein
VDRGLKVGPTQPNYGIRCPRLFHGPRKAVKHTAASTGWRSMAMTRPSGDQVTAVEVGLNCPPEGRLLADMLTQQVSAGDVRDAEPRGE